MARRWIVTVDGEAELRPGETLYDRHCYFCHGYDGDARTEAAALLDPPPVSFRRACHLDRGRILEVLRSGAPGTAMMSFADRLDEAGMRAVAAFVQRRFVRGGPPAGAYHTPGNGWPDHARRYAAAYPFVRGEIAADLPDAHLSAAQRAGRELFRTSCVTCHEGRSGDGHGGHAEEDEEVYEHGWQGPPAPPLPADATPALRSGERLYASLCAACHGRDGTAENWVGEFLRPRPPDIADALARLNDDALACIVRKGLPGTSMPAFGRILDASQLAALLAYLREVIAAAPGQGASAPSGTASSRSMPSITVVPMKRPMAY